MLIFFLYYAGISVGAKIYVDVDFWLEYVGRRRMIFNGYWIQTHVVGPVHVDAVYPYEIQMHLTYLY